MELGAALTAVISLIGVLVKLWIDGKPKREEEKASDKLQQGRQDIVQGNTDAIEQRIDQLCGGSGGSAPGVQSPEDFTRRISAL